MALNALESYAQGGFRAVHGWLTLEGVRLVSQISRVQNVNGIHGPVCEIGVHDGKLFTLLHLLEPEYLAGGIDLFEEQEANSDSSGYGDHLRALANAVKHGGDPARIRLLASNSLALSAKDITDLCGGKPRLFSVDGGHTAECTYNDLCLAAESVASGGAVILDDYFNPQWPGVAEGTCQFMHDRNGALILVAIGGNKVVFAKDDGRMYANVCQDLAGATIETLRQRVAKSWLWRRIRKVPHIRSVLTRRSR